MLFILNFISVFIELIIMILFWSRKYNLLNISTFVTWFFNSVLNMRFIVFIVYFWIFIFLLRFTSFFIVVSEELESINLFRKLFRNSVYIWNVVISLSLWYINIHLVTTFLNRKIIPFELPELSTVQPWQQEIYVSYLHFWDMYKDSLICYIIYYRLNKRVSLKASLSGLYFQFSELCSPSLEIEYDLASS